MLKDVLRWVYEIRWILRYIDRTEGDETKSEVRGSKFNNKLHVIADLVVKLTYTGRGNLSYRLPLSD